MATCRIVNDSMSWVVEGETPTRPPPRSTCFRAICRDDSDRIHLLDRDVMPQTTRDEPLVLCPTTKPILARVIVSGGGKAHRYDGVLVKGKRLHKVIVSDPDPSLPNKPPAVTCDGKPCTGPLPANVGCDSDLPPAAPPARRKTKKKKKK